MTEDVAGMGRAVAAGGFYSAGALVALSPSANYGREDSKASLKPRQIASEVVAPHDSQAFVGLHRTWAGYSRVFNGPTPSSGSQRAKSYYDLFYERIHYDPATLNLGQLMNVQTRELTIWNAYFEKRTLQSLSEQDAGGLYFDISMPMAFAALQSHTITLSATSEGPPTIDAVFTFNWDNGPWDYRVIGERLVVLAFQPSTVQPYVERLKWYGTVATAYSGREQRMALSDHPKITYEYVTQVVDEERYQLESVMWGWQNRIFAVPVWNSTTYIRQTANIGDTVIQVESTAYREFRNDSLAIIFAGPGLYEAVEVQTVGADYLVVKKPLGFRWTRRVQIMPIRLMRMAREISYQSPVANFKEVSINLMAEGGEEVKLVPWVSTYKSIPVMDFSPDMAGEMAGTYERNLEWVEGEYSLSLAIDRSGVGTIKQSLQYTFESYQAAQSFKSVLNELKGTQGVFWMPTWAADMELERMTPAGSIYVYVHAASRTNMYSDLRGRKHIAVYLHDGTTIYREIISILNGGESAPGTELITVDEPFTAQLQPHQVKMISFMSQSRFENEAFEFNWVTQDWATLNVAIKGLSDGV